MSRNRKKATWHPNEDEKALLEAYQDVGFVDNWSQIATRAAEIRNKKPWAMLKYLYRHLDSVPEFATEWEKLPKKITEKYKPDVALAVAEQAKKGDIKAARLFYEVSGDIKRKHEHEHKGLIEIRAQIEGRQDAMAKKLEEAERETES